MKSLVSTLSSFWPSGPVSHWETGDSVALVALLLFGILQAVILVAFFIRVLIRRRTSGFENRETELVWSVVPALLLALIYSVGATDKALPKQEARQKHQLESEKPQPLASQVILAE